MLGNKVEDSSNQAPDDIENAYKVASKKVKDSSNQAPDEKERADIVTSMRKKLDGLSPLSPHCCIYKVPERLRWVKRPAYTPHVVSIGPLHHYKDNIDNKDRKVLLYMEEHKQRYLQLFLRRTRVDLEVYVKKIMAHEKRLRGCYEGEATEFKSDKFVSIILVDAAFIIELLLRNFKRLEDDNDWIFTKPWMLQNIAPDMILLENQLPFFILVDLLAFVPPEDLVAAVPPEDLVADERPHSIIELSYEFFQKTVGLQVNKKHLAKISSCSEVKHFVDLIRTLYVPPPSKSSQTGEALNCTPSTPGWSTSCSPKFKRFCDRITRSLPFKKSQTPPPLESSQTGEALNSTSSTPGWSTSCSPKVKRFCDRITRSLPFKKSQTPLPLESSQTGEALNSTPSTPGWSSSCSPKVKRFCDRITRSLPFKKSQTERPHEGTPNTACTSKLHQAGRTLNTPCAKKLHQAGVKFQVSSSQNLFDIQFNDKGILEIPQVEIHDYTELTFRNLLAFEQCHFKENHIRDYLRIMDGFVNTQMDVDLLVEYGIVVNTLGDNNKVSDLINKLCIGVSWNNKNYYFAALSEDLNNYCRKPWNKSKASLKQKYFNTPWAMISVFAAGFLIVLAIIQAVCSIISVIN